MSFFLTFNQESIVGMVPVVKSLRSSPCRSGENENVRCCFNFESNREKGAERKKS
jgi:hypothetical protein